VKVEVLVKAEALFVMAEELFVGAAVQFVDADKLKAETLFVEAGVLPV